MINLLAMPAGATSLWLLWSVDATGSFWFATAAFFVYCVLNSQVEAMGRRPPSSTVAVQMATLAATLILGAFGLFAWFWT